MKNKFNETIKFIEQNKNENIKKLIAMPVEKIEELRDYYYNWYKDAKESGYKESAEVNYLHYQTIKEALTIKKGNEELNSPAADTKANR